MEICSYGWEIRISVSSFIFIFSGDGQILPGSVCTVHDNLISCHLYLSPSKCYCIVTDPFFKGLLRYYNYVPCINKLSLEYLNWDHTILPLADWQITTLSLGGSRRDRCRSLGTSHSLSLTCQSLCSALQCPGTIIFSSLSSLRASRLCEFLRTFLHGSDIILRRSMLKIQ